MKLALTEGKRNCFSHDETDPILSHSECRKESERV